MSALAHVARPRLRVCRRRWRVSNHLPITQRRAATFDPTRETIESQVLWIEKTRKIKAGMEKSLVTLLEERGLVKDIAGGREALDHLLTEKPVGVYVGVDPTAPSLHVGHLLPLMVLYWMYLFGYPAVSLLGTATVDIGDPSGRTSARTPQAKQAKMHNIESMREQLKRLWRHVNGLGIRHGFTSQITREQQILQNYDWHKNVTALELIGTLGSGMRLGAMLNRDSVQARMESGNGMSLSEFCYPLFQGYDWWRMYRNQGVQVQVGGSDQYGNICAGIEAVDIMRKARSGDSDMSDPLRGAYGFTTPLLTTASGEKFGKSAGNAVWLDPEMMSSYDLYKYMLGTADNDVERYLKLFTFIPIDQISLVIRAHEEDPSKRIAQHLLAKEVVELAHGAKQAKETEEAHRHAFSFGANNYSLQVLRTTLAAAAKAGDVKSHQKHGEALLEYKKTFARAASGTPTASAAATPSNAKENLVTLPYTFLKSCTFPQLLYAAGLVSSRGEGQRLIRNKGAYVVRPNSGAPATPFNLVWDKIADVDVPHDFLIDFEAVVIRTGKTNLRICRVLKTEDWEAQGLDFPGWQEFRAKAAESENPSEKSAKSRTENTKN